ncbi:MAG TPA: GDSL-type esterase/lipase family protein [Aquabacterium sp.]|uniref:GDSL-type esterase/lipase family protein n=1 Tax=Aquabacterium sp. TaxID=1872578 RepID=UPI002E34F1AB|nr:GDSL-type esterase/lipase family protein [Aquabacterium sp.]HEX5356225.1 GDSL-type esterase/lipase family protein [Aquabacterium sp.]
MKFKHVLGAAACVMCMLAGPASAEATGQTATWVAAWGAPQSDAFLSLSLNNQTLRQVVTVHQQGQAIRVRLSNRHGTEPVHVDDMQLGLSAGDAAVVPGSSRSLRFGGQSAIVLKPGASAWSDPLPLTVKPMQRLTLSFHAPGHISALSRHFGADEYLWRASGNQTTTASGQTFARIDNGLQRSWALIDGVDVQTHQPGRVLVAFGDSITDGYVPDPNVPLVPGTALNGKDERYPDFLSRRLIAANQNVSVVNAGISGNRLLSPPPLPMFGEQGTQRLQRDVLDVAGVTDALVLIGINDLGLALWPRADTLIAGLQATAQRLKQAGVRAIFGTLLPARDALPQGLMHGRASVEAARQQVNQWIRTSGIPDAVVDFDACLRDPANPARLRAEYDSGDHLHPGARGYEAMGECVDLALF